MAMEFHSSGHSFDDRLRQAQGYAAYLLAARPDLNSTLGLLVEKDCMIILICASSGTKMVKVKKSDCPTVLAAIVKYLNNGQLNVRASHIIKTVAPDGRATFTLNAGGGHSWIALLAQGVIHLAVGLTFLSQRKWVEILWSVSSRNSGLDQPLGGQRKRSWIRFTKVAHTQVWYGLSSFINTWHQQASIRLVSAFWIQGQISWILKRLGR